MEKDQTLPEFLKKLRKSCHYRQDYVAGKLNITRQTYSHYETGRINPPAAALCKLSELYGVPVEGMLSYAAGVKPAKGQDDIGSLKWQLLCDFQKLDERNRDEILSIIQIKLKKQNCGELDEDLRKDIRCRK